MVIFMFVRLKCLLYENKHFMHIKFCFHLHYQHRADWAYVRDSSIEVIFFVLCVFVLFQRKKNLNLNTSWFKLLLTKGSGKAAAAQHYVWKRDQLNDFYRL